MYLQRIKRYAAIVYISDNVNNIINTQTYLAPIIIETMKVFRRKILVPISPHRLITLWIILDNITNLALLCIHLQLNAYD